MNDNNQQSSGSPVFAEQASPSYGQREFGGRNQVSDSVLVGQQVRSPFPLVENVEASQVTRIYKPLSGDELAEAIGEHLKQQVIKQLRNSGKIEPHLIYESPIWRGEIAVRWKATANNETVALVAEGVHEGRLIYDSEDKNSALIEAVHVDPNTPPDTIREATNQPIPVVMKGPGGGQNVVRVPNKTFKPGRR